MDIKSIVQKAIEIKSGSKTFLNAGFFLYESFVMCILFADSSPIIWVKIMMIALGLLASSFHLYSIMLIKTMYIQYTETINKKLIVQMIGVIVLYISLALLSFVSQYGFNLMLINQEYSDIVDIDQNKKIISKDIDKYQKLIDNILVKQLNTNLQNWQFNTYEKQRKQYELEIDKLKSQKEITTNEKKKGDMYYYFSEQTGIDRKAILNYILIMLWFIVELGLVMTANSIKRKETKKPQTELIKYINSLFEFSSRGRLQADKDIEARTGIELRKCAAYRKLLSSTLIDGKPCIVTMPGGAVSELEKEQVINHFLIEPKD